MPSYLPIYEALKVYQQPLEDGYKVSLNTISMDGKDRATDNICIERFWRSAKVERIYLNE